MRYLKGRDGNPIGVEFDNNKQLLEAISSKSRLPDLGIFLKENPDVLEQMKETEFLYNWVDENAVLVTYNKEGIEITVRIGEYSMFGESAFLATFRLPRSVSKQKIKRITKRQSICFRIFNLKQTYNHVEDDPHIVIGVVNVR